MTWVYDPVEERSWGPFDSDEEAERFIASDKYLESWCVMKSKPKDDVYPPEAYHGRWPLREGGRATVAACKHCGRAIVNEGGMWIDPNATGDDGIWRTCDANDAFEATHEPEGQ